MRVGYSSIRAPFVDGYFSQWKRAREIRVSKPFRREQGRHHHTKTDVFDERSEAEVVAGGTAREPLIDEEGAAAQHTGVRRFFIFASILNVVRVRFLQTVSPLPNITAHVRATVGRVALRGI